jgi:diguanylate cyclase (GGDEF)-like protein
MKMRYRSRGQIAASQGIGMLVRVALTLLLFVISLIGAEWAASADAERLARAQHDQVLVHATDMRARLESSLNSTVFRAQGLVGYVIGVGTPSEPQVSRALQAVHDSDPRIRNVALAPGNRITRIYPLAGNEKALGLAYESVPGQWPSVRHAMESQQSVLAGPVQLVQGGSAIINRTPIFLSDNRYWGMISTVIDLPGLLADAGIAAEVEGVQYWLYGDNAGADGSTLIVGQGEPGAQALRMSINVPGGHWLLYGESLAGAQAASRELLFVRIVLYGLAFLATGLGYALLSGNAKARALALQLRTLNGDLQASNDELHQLARHDDLTMLPNRRAFEERLETSWQISLRSALPLTVMMIDADRFKAINDVHGHAAGDRTLVALAAAIRGQIRRGGDLVARYGGEEFVVVAVGLEPAQALELAEQIRVAVRDAVVRPGDGTPVTVSIGVATGVPRLDGEPRQLLERADRALYQAKNDGRDRVCSAQFGLTA